MHHVVAAHYDDRHCRADLAVLQGPQLFHQFAGLAAHNGHVAQPDRAPGGPRESLCQQESHCGFGGAGAHAHGQRVAQQRQFQPIAVVMAAEVINGGDRFSRVTRGQQPASSPQPFQNGDHADSCRKSGRNACHRHGSVGQFGKDDGNGACRFDLADRFHGLIPSRAASLVLRNGRALKSRWTAPAPGVAALRVDPIPLNDPGGADISAGYSGRAALNVTLASYSCGSRGPSWTLGGGHECQRQAPARWPATLQPRWGAPGEDQALANRLSASAGPTTPRQGRAGSAARSQAAPEVGGAT